MKQIMIIMAILAIAVSAFGQGRLNRLDNPSPDSAREFFNWQIEKKPIFNSEGQQIQGFSEFRRGVSTLHVGNSSYNPAQPGVAYGKVEEALKELSLPYSVKGVGEFDSGANIFAQFAVDGKDSFSIGGKDYKGYLTMAKGSDETIPLAFWLTVVTIICRNTFRMALKALKGSDLAVRMRQTKNSDTRLSAIQKEIVALFLVQESVQQTLNAMAQRPITLNQAERAFLGLLREDNTESLKDTGKTRLSNTLDQYKAAFNNPKAGSNGQTVEDWFNAVTYIGTHGNSDSPRFNADKQYLSSEFGRYADRKERAFGLAANTESFNRLIVTGDEIMNELLSRPVIVQPVQSSANVFADLLNR